MSGSYACFLRRRREILGLTQRELERRSGVKQPLIAAIEAGTRKPSAAARAALDRAIALRPSTALAARNSEVRALFTAAGLPEPVVFGSVARGTDVEESDVDLLVEFSDRHDIVDLLGLEHELAQILTVDVDIVDARARGAAAHSARDEAAPL